MEEINIKCFSFLYISSNRYDRIPIKRSYTFFVNVPIEWSILKHKCVTIKFKYIILTEASKELM